MNKESRIYVAGHRGLVGSAIVKCLQEKGYENIIVRTHAELDLLDPQAVRAFFDEEQPEYVVLAAAKVGGILANTTFRADFIYENLQIQQHVIGESFRHHVKKLLFLGSTCVYPRESRQPMSEDELLTSSLEYTNEPYAIAKIAGLKMCESFNLQYGTNFIAVMPSNLYGPHDNFDLKKGHVLPVLLRKFHLAKCLYNEDWSAIMQDLNRNPIAGIDGKASRQEMLAAIKECGVLEESGVVKVEIWGTGKPLREFLWSEDMSHACVFLMENINFQDIVKISNRNHPDEVRNCHINIGTEEELTIADLVKLVVKVVDFKGEYFFNSDKPDGTMRKLTDCSKIHELGWKHEKSIAQGVAALYHWYQTSLSE